MAVYDGAGLWGAVATTVGAAGNVWSSITVAKAQENALNAQRDITAQNNAFSLFSEDQKTKDLIKIVAIIGVIIVLAIVLLIAFKRK